MPDINDFYRPMEALNKMISQTDELTKRQKELLIPCGYGHMADGDIQISIGVNDSGEEGKVICDKLTRLADEFLFQYVAERGGSITGEHGVGQQRALQLSAAKNQGLYSAMTLIKKSFDPEGILNPYKVLPPL